MTVLGTDRDHLGRPEYEQLVDRLGVRERPVADDRVQEVVAELDAVADNGAALARRFDIVDEDGVFEYVRETPNSSVENMLRYSSFLPTFLRSPDLNASVDGLDTEDGLVGSGDVADDFERFDPLLLDGFLARRLVRGGPYSSFEGSQAAAKELGRQFERAVVGDRYGSFCGWQLTGTRWSTWFSGIRHQDETLVLVDEAERTLWLFVFTARD